jgi:putative flippase GtrA
MEKIVRMMRHMLNDRLFRVAAIGVVGLCVQTVIFEVFGIWLELLRPSLATLIGAEFGVITNFLLNNRYSFKDRVHAPFLVRLMRFHIVVLGSLALQWISVFTAESLTTNLWILHGAYALGVILGFISNYTGYRLWVWRDHTAKFFYRTAKNSLNTSTMYFFSVGKHLVGGDIKTVVVDPASNRVFWLKIAKKLLFVRLVNERQHIASFDIVLSRKCVSSDFCTGDDSLITIGNIMYTWSACFGFHGN